MKGDAAKENPADYRGERGSEPRSDFGAKTEEEKGWWAPMLTKPNVTRAMRETETLIQPFSAM